MSAELRQSLRGEHLERTRERILEAFARCLADQSAEDVPVSAVAERAGVAERTVYRHFPTRVDLLAAAGQWISSTIFSYVPTSTPDELPAAFRTACQRFDEQPNLAYAIALSQLGRSVRAGFRQQIVAAQSRALHEVTDNLPTAETRRAQAVFAYLDNVLAWATMREELDLSGAEVADAVEWVMSTLVADLRRRNDAAASGGH